MEKKQELWVKLYNSIIGSLLTALITCFFPLFVLFVITIPFSFLLIIPACIYVGLIAVLFLLRFLPILLVFIFELLIFISKKLKKKDSKF